MNMHGNCHFVGCGFEAAIGRLTRLTSLQIYIDRAQAAPSPLQLQLLGCSGVSSTAGVSGTRNSSASGRAIEGYNTSLRELSLEIGGQLSDDELAAAAKSLPDLRRLEVYRACEGTGSSPCGAGLAAFSACQRLRDISLRRCSNLDGQQLVEQLPRIGSLATLQIVHCPGVGISAMRELRAAFKAEHGRRLLVHLTYPGRELFAHCQTEDVLRVF